MSMRRHATMVAVAFLPALPVPRAPGPSGVIPFTLTDAGGVIVPVFFDGRGPHPFLVDTGANRSAVADGLVRRLGLAPVAKMLVVTPAGNELRAVVQLVRPAVGPALAGEILASVLEGDRLRVDGVEADGILGQDFLSRFDYTIDYRRRRLAWGSAAASRPGIRLAMRRSEGRFLVDLPQPGNDQPFRLVPDTGANGLVIFERAGGFRVATESLPGGSRLGSSSGRSRAVEMRRVPSLQVGSVTLRDQLAAVVSRPEADAPEGDGLLPLHQFASVTFESHAGYLIIRAR